MLDPLSVTLPLAIPQPRLRPILPKRKLLTPSPDHPDDYIIELDYSSFSELIRCPRAGENSLIHGREAARDRSATEFGKLFHKLEELRRLQTPDLHKVQTETIVQHFIDQPVPPTDHRTSDRMMNLMKLYNEKFEKDGMVGRILHDDNGPFVERPFKIELATVEVNEELPYEVGVLINDENYPYKNKGLHLFVRNLHILYTGRIDAAVEEASALWVWDDKTTSRGGREFAEAFRLSLQTRGYAWALQKITSRPVIGCIVNAVIVRPLTKTGTHTEFNRMNYFYSQDSLSEWEDNAKAIVTDFVAMLQRGYFPQYARSFMSPCTYCDYQDNCALPRKQRAADLASDLYRDVTWNPTHE